MCINFFNVRQSNFRNVQNAGKCAVFAPCGQCPECRKIAQYSWAWRLTAEIQHCVKTRGYQVGFITLTYNDEHLPRLPRFSEPELAPLSNRPCFNRDHTDKLIKYIRKVGHRDYGLTDIKYFVTSEYGPATKRPHYHMIIAWDASKITGESIHGLIRHWWREYMHLGFVSPDRPCGGALRRSGAPILPFVLDTLSKGLDASFYTAKYATKDLDWYSMFYDQKGELICSKKFLKSLKQYMPHHRQSKSLGFSAVASLSDAEKVDLLEHGKSFLGSDRLMMPPLYIRNKLLFTPYYILDDSGKRLVKQSCTDFYKQHFDAIIGRKLKYFDALFDAMKKPDYWLSRGVNTSLPYDVFMDASSLWGDRTSYYPWEFMTTYDNYDYLGCKLSEAYLFYYGMKREYCFKDKKATFFNRYNFPANTYSSIQLEFKHWFNIQRFFRFLMQFTCWEQESGDSYEARYLKDYYNQVPQSEVG